MSTNNTNAEIAPTASQREAAASAIRKDLDKRMLLAHENDDPTALIATYTEAGDTAEQAGDIDAACFYLTHAMVFALEAGEASAGALRARLVSYGRDEHE